MNEKKCRWMRVGDEYSKRVEGGFVRGVAEEEGLLIDGDGPLFFTRKELEAIVLSDPVGGGLPKKARKR